MVRLWSPITEAKEAETRLKHIEEDVEQELTRTNEN